MSKTLAEGRLEELQTEAGFTRVITSIFGAHTATVLGDPTPNIEMMEELNALGEPRYLPPRHGQIHVDMNRIHMYRPNA